MSVRGRMKEPYLDTLNLDTFAELLSYRYKYNPGTVAVMYFNGDDKISVSYKELIGDVAKLSAFFEENGISGCNIGIFSENRYEYIPIYLASVFFMYRFRLIKKAMRRLLRVALINLMFRFCFIRQEQRIKY